MLTDLQALRPHLFNILTALTRFLLPTHPTSNPYPTIWSSELFCKLIKSLRRHTLPPHIATALIAALSETSWIETVGNLIGMVDTEPGRGVYMALSSLFTLMQAVAKTAAVSVDENGEMLAVVVQRIVRVIGGDGVARLIEAGAPPSTRNEQWTTTPPHQHTLRKLLDLVHVLSIPTPNDKQLVTTSLLHIPAQYLNHRFRPPPDADAEQLMLWPTIPSPTEAGDYTEFVTPTAHTTLTPREPLKTSLLTLLTVLAHLLTSPSPNGDHDSAWRVLSGLDDAFSDDRRQGCGLVDWVLRMYADNDAMMAAVLRVGVEIYGAVCGDGDGHGERVPRFVDAVKTHFNPHVVFATWVANTCGGGGESGWASEDDRNDAGGTLRGTEAAALHILDQMINDDAAAGFTAYLLAYLRFASSFPLSSSQQEEQQHVPRIARILTCLADKLDQACEGGLFPFDARVLVRRCRGVEGESDCFWLG